MDNTDEIKCENCKLWKPMSNLQMGGPNIPTQGSCGLLDSNGLKVRGITSADFACSGLQQGEYDPIEYRKYVNSFHKG